MTLENMIYYLSTWIAANLFTARAGSHGERHSFAICSLLRVYYYWKSKDAPLHIDLMDKMQHERQSHASHHIVVVANSLSNGRYAVALLPWSSHYGM